ncbi:MAG: peptidase S15 [Actinobacteria bacterium]|nr:peptidase S15 [Actinomycetota bacterium]
MRKHRVAAFLVCVSTAVGLLAGGAAHADNTITDGTVTSADGTVIYYTLFRPASADATHQVPMILHSHGWGQSRSTSGFNDWLNDGFGVLSFDQRGHGESQSIATVEDPDKEGQDVRALIDFVATLDWVKLDAPGDPVLGAIGGSYGGGYQTIGALKDLRDRGATRFNALAPEITWFDLPESLGPQGVPRTLWTTLLYGVAPPHADYIDQGEAVGLATGDFPDGTVPGTVNLKDIFYRHSPRWFADNGYNLDIPVLFGQGITDNLFNLNQGVHNWSDVLTANARSKSIFVGYNQGHVLPEAFPLGTNPSGNPCIDDWDAYERSFFHAAFAGLNPRTKLDAAAFNLATSSNDCIRTDDISTYESFSPAPLGSTIVVSAPAGPPVAYSLAAGPIQIAGVPHLRGSLTAAGVDARAFFALAVGMTPADARVIQNNVMPIRSLLQSVAQPFDIELPGVAVDIPAGSNLYLMVASTATAFAGTTRAPGAIVISDAVVDVPVQ